jgi:mersacidin/lichenicidin family type 2 lantibiotic
MEVTKETIVRAWKDEAYYKSLPGDVQEAIPARPAGDDGSELSDEQLETAAGGITPGFIVAGVVAGGLASGIAVEELTD